MNRPPWETSIIATRYRGSEDMEHLQTDVMRFMAILGFCLVAIFALVRSIPTDPIINNTDHPAAAANQEPSQPRPKPIRPQLSAPKPGPVIPQPGSTNTNMIPTARDAKKLPNKTTKEIQSRQHIHPQDPTAPSEPPTISKAVRSPINNHVPHPAMHSAEPVFTLRFDSDRTFKKLLDQGKVILYAVTNQQAWRLTPDGGYTRFRVVSPQPQLHIVAAATLPNSLVRELEKLETSTETVTWGVTLPDTTTGEIRQLLRRQTGGALVIEADARVRLEPHPDQYGADP
ncbi:MAG: hypothetical protein GY731_00965 [Gammaproteobacteria bacterium]|nr:hypothetical protein [Gammaproteobacteria bacterium]